MSNGRLVGRYRLPHIDGQPSQTKAALRVTVKLTLDANERPVLGVLCERMDGAGVCFLTYDLLTHQAGIGCTRTVQRTVARLKQKELVEVYRSRRDPSRYSAHLPRYARQGDGPNWWRLGAAVRFAVGLQEVDMASVYGSASAAPQIASVSPPGSPVSDLLSIQPGTPLGSCSGRSRVVPRDGAVSVPSLQEKASAEAGVHVTPRTENYKQPLSEEERLVLSNSTRGDTLRNTSEIVALLPLRETLIVIEAEGLVDSEQATWIEPGWPA